MTCHKCQFWKAFKASTNLGQCVKLSIKSSNDYHCLEFKSKGETK